MERKVIHKKLFIKIIVFAVTISFLCQNIALARPYALAPSHKKITIEKMQEIAKKLLEEEKAKRAEFLDQPGAIELFGSQIGKGLVFEANEKPEEIVKELTKKRYKVKLNNNIEDIIENIQLYFKFIRTIPDAKDITKDIESYQIEFRKNVKNYAAIEGNKIYIDIALLNLKDKKQKDIGPEDLRQFLSFILGHEGSHILDQVVNEEAAQEMDVERFKAFSRKHQRSVLNVLTRLGAERSYINRLKKERKLIRLKIDPNPVLEDEETVKKIMTEIVNKNPKFGGDWTKLKVNGSIMSETYYLSDGKDKLTLKRIVNAWQVKLAKEKDPDLKWEDALKKVISSSALAYIVVDICGERLDKRKLIRLKIDPNPVLEDEETVKKIMTEIVNKNPKFGGDWTKLKINQSIMRKPYFLIGGKDKLTLQRIVNTWRVKLAREVNPDLSREDAWRKVTQKAALDCIVEDICGEKLEKEEERDLIQLEIDPNFNLEDRETVKKIMTEIVNTDPYFNRDWTKLSTSVLGETYFLSDGKTKLNLRQIVQTWQVKLAREVNPDLKWKDALGKVTSYPALTYIVEDICGKRLAKKKLITFSDMYVSQKIDPKLEEAFDITGKYQVLDDDAQANPADYGLFGAGDLVGDNEKKQALAFFVMEAKEILKNDKEYPYKTEVKNARVVAVEGLPYDGHYGTGGAGKDIPSVYISWDVMEYLFERHNSGDKDAVYALSDFIFRKVTKPLLAQTIKQKEKISIEEARKKAQEIVFSSYQKGSFEPILEHKNGNKLSGAQLDIVNAFKSGWLKDINLMWKKNVIGTPKDPLMKKLVNALKQIGGKMGGKEITIRFYPGNIAGSRIGGIYRDGKRLFALRVKRDNVEEYTGKDADSKIDWNWIEEKFSGEQVMKMVDSADPVKRTKLIREVYDWFKEQLGEDNVSLKEEEAIVTASFYCALEDVFKEAKSIFNIYTKAFGLNPKELDEDDRIVVIRAVYRIALRKAEGSLKNVLELFEGALGKELKNVDNAEERKQLEIAVINIAANVAETSLKDVLELFQGALGKKLGEVEDIEERKQLEIAVYNVAMKKAEGALEKVLELFEGEGALGKKLGEVEDIEERKQLEIAVYIVAMKKAEESLEKAIELFEIMGFKLKDMKDPERKCWEKVIYGVAMNRVSLNEVVLLFEDVLGKKLGDLNVKTDVTDAKKKVLFSQREELIGIVENLKIYGKLFQLLSSKKKWTKTKIVEEIIKYHREGKKLNPYAMHKSNVPGVSALYKLGARVFDGGWEEALEKAGLEPDDIYLLPKEIREKMGRRGELPPGNIILSDPKKFKTKEIGEVLKEWQNLRDRLSIELRIMKGRVSTKEEVEINSLKLIGEGNKHLEFKLDGYIKEGIHEGESLVFETVTEGESFEAEIKNVRGSLIVAQITKREWNKNKNVKKAYREKFESTASLETEIAAVKNIWMRLNNAKENGESILGEDKGFGHKVWNALLKLKAPKPTRPKDLKQAVEALQWIDKDVEEDKSQNKAVRMALNLESLVSVIWGSPGTGKTKVIVEIARQFLRKGKRVLIVSQMNQAVDVAMERLVEKETQLSLLRLGNNPNSIKKDSVRDIWIGNDEHRDKIKTKYEKNPEEGVIVGSTSVSVDLDKHFKDLPENWREFDVVIVDESSRERWSGASIPFLRATDKVVIVGDPIQLPPMEDKEVKEILKNNGLDENKHYQGMMDDFVDCGYDQVFLSTNYRSHPLIAKLVNRLFYPDKQLGTCDLEEYIILEDTVKVIDTSIEDAKKRKEQKIRKKPAGDTFCNPYEAVLAAKEAKRLLGEGVLPEDITFITPYDGQVNKIIEELGKKKYGFVADELNILIKNVTTIDAVQAGENKVTILSFVRSNQNRRNVGFLEDLRRLNVAMSRAEERLIIIGDMDTLKKSNNEIFKDLEDYYENTVKPAVAAVKEADAKKKEEAELKKLLPAVEKDIDSSIESIKSIEGVKSAA